MKKKIFIISLVFICLLFSGCQSKDNTSGVIDNISYNETEDITNYVKIELNNGKIMLLELYPDIAPITVANFQKLVSEHFYDKLVFHRIVDGFMIQGGYLTDKGKEKRASTIKGEFILNGFTNTLKHTKGVISMARSNDYDSASSQFFICLDDTPHLDGSYASFGKLIAGFNVLEELGKTKVNGEEPIKKPVIKSIRFIKI